jgi:hypothetical protein
MLPLRASIRVRHQTIPSTAENAPSRSEREGASGDSKRRLNLHAFASATSLECLDWAGQVQCSSQAALDGGEWTSKVKVRFVSS